MRHETISQGHAHLMTHRLKDEKAVYTTSRSFRDVTRQDDVVAKSALNDVRVMNRQEIIWCQARCG